MAEDIIRAEDLTKAYGNVRAVKGISFSVGRGSLFSFLGVNGAGKSTTINILCSILSKDGGKVEIGGYDLDREPDKIKPLLGVVFQGTVLDDLLTVRDNLTVRASFYGLYGRKWAQRLAELARLLELKDLLNRPFGKLSGGQKRRADIARALIGRPHILVLDEPTTGLDPQTRRTVWGIVRKLREKEGMTVFLTTHYMEEADGSDRVVIIDGGKIAAEGTPVQLKNRFSRNYLRLYGDAPALAERARSVGLNAAAEGGACVIAAENAAEARGILVKYPDLCADFEFVKGNMDDVFLSVTGKKLQGGNE